MLLPLLFQIHLLQSISVKLIYQFLYLIYGYLFFRCLGKVFEERNKNKEGNSRGVTTSQLPQKEIGMITFLVLSLYLLARIRLTLISSSAIGCFKKVNFQLPCDLLKKQAVLCGNYRVLLNITDSLLCVTNCCIKVTSK